MHRFHTPLLLAAVFAVSLPARAEFLNNSSGLVNPDQTITFDEVPLTPNEPVTTQFQTYGVIFTGAWGNPDPASYPNISGNRIGNFVSNGGSGGILTMNFSQAVGGVAFSMVNVGEATFTALLDGVVVEMGTAPTSISSNSNFYGFRDIALDEVIVNVTAANPAALFDNLQTAVPEPASWALMLGGMLLLSQLAVRRKR